jgi:hypothetical protein
MSRLFRAVSGRDLLVGLLACLAVGAVALAEELTPREALEKATADGKYTKLLAVISVPDDKDDYGEFNDYGHWDGTEWAGYKGLPEGNWVYVYPHWYIWGKEGKGGTAAVGALRRASVKGKYSGLLAVIRVPDDKDDYGEFNDYGPYDGTEWAGYEGLPKGNWVYVYPHWYIWEKSSE